MTSYGRMYQKYTTPTPAATAAGCFHPITTTSCPTHTRRPRTAHPNTRHPPLATDGPPCRRGVAATDRRRGRRPAVGAAPAAGAAASGNGGSPGRGRRQRRKQRPGAGAVPAAGAATAGVAAAHHTASPFRRRNQQLYTAEVVDRCIQHDSAGTGQRHPARLRRRHSTRPGMRLWRILPTRGAQDNVCSASADVS